MKSTKLALTVAITAAIGMSAPAFAQYQEQQQQQQPPMQQQQAPDVDVSHAQLEQFVDAQHAITEIRDEYTQKLQAAEDQEAQQQLQMEANEAMTDAVESSGLEVDDFNEIAMALQADEELRDRYMELIQADQ